MQFNKEILEAFASHASDPLFVGADRERLVEAAAAATPDAPAPQA